MTDGEIADLLDGRHSMAVATLDASGQPHLVAMWYGFLGGERWPDADLAFWTYARSQKVVNLRRDPRITCLVDTGGSYDQLRGVQIAGHATIHDDTEVVTSVGISVHRRYQGGVVGDAVRAGLAEMGRKRVAVRVHAETVVSWDHRKLS
jgi:PPOX class probable F420-dependent enzyme